MSARPTFAAIPEPDMHPVTCRISRARDLGGTLAVTVPTSRLLHVRRAIVQAGCADVGIVKATPLACGTRVRLLVAAQPESFPRITESIHRALDESGLHGHAIRRAA